MLQKRLSDDVPQPNDFIRALINGGVSTSGDMDSLSKKRSFTIEFTNYAFIQAIVNLQSPESSINANKVLNYCLRFYIEYLQDSLPDKDLNKLVDAYDKAYQALIDEELPGLNEGFDFLKGQAF
ncbi:hypothetical protein [Synechocystis sp. PCC 6803]|uniref:hypothetical protein n=1 Tax=Synechocystis sp. PCC 6803 TaxID=1148 RepID=UPI00000BCC23|nr:hypothetical protein [Synechocystis sp. PCC 6803]AAA97419.1 orf2 [Synechocystis sp. PCC 6803]AGF53822.1 hypothetical protein MYO_820 [Synechocystis sp. PCC 6803]